MQTERLEKIRTALENTVKAGIEKSFENSYNEDSKLKEAGYETTDRKRNAGTTEGISDAGQGRYSLYSDNKGEKRERLEKSSSRSESGAAVRIVREGSARYTYTVAELREINKNAIDFRNECRKYGFDCIVFKRKVTGKDASTGEYGEIEPVEAGTTKKGLFFAGNNIENEGKEIFGHEVLHHLLRKNSTSGQKYYLSVANNINQSSIEFKKMKKILRSKGYESDEIGEEVVAYFSGWIYGVNYGNSSDYCREMLNKYSATFKNFDAVLKAHAEMVQEELFNKGTRFSMSEPVEETKNLIAVHNLTEEKLKKVLELGGMASPSIALIKRGTEHSGFGSISFLFNKETIDPQRDSRNRVYSADDLKEWQSEGSNDKTVFIIGETGDVLQGLGAMEQSIYMNGDKINTILKEHPEMNIDIISKIPDILDEPILILKSRAVESKKINTRVVIYSDVKAENGLPVLAVLDLKPVENGLYVDDMQKVNSAYTKEYNPEQFLRKSDVLYIHDNKKRTGRLFQRLGFYNAQLMALTGSIGSISYRGSKVNIKGVPFNDVIDDSNTRLSKSQADDSDYTVSGQAVKELSKKLIGEYSANMKVTELADKLAVALDYMQEGFGNPDFNFDTAVDKIRSVAREMVESASVVSTEYGGEYLEVRDVIREMKFYLDDKYKADLTGVENYGEFHKKYPIPKINGELHYK